jgi:hypothetical protein
MEEKDEKVQTALTDLRAEIESCEKVSQLNFNVLSTAAQSDNWVSKMCGALADM